VKGIPKSPEMNLSLETKSQTPAEFELVRVIGLLDDPTAADPEGANLQLSGKRLNLLRET